VEKHIIWQQYLLFLEILLLNLSIKKKSFHIKYERSLDKLVPSQPNPFLNITSWRNNHLLVTPSG